MRDQPTLRFSLRCEAECRLCFPVAAQETLYAKPPHLPCPKGSPRQTGPRRLPARQRDRRPGSLHITSSCASTGCGAVTLTASRRPRRHAAPAAWQSSRQLAGILHASRPLPPFGKAWRGRVPQPPPIPGCSPPSIPKGAPPGTAAPCCRRSHDLRKTALESAGHWWLNQKRQLN
jgi:hypothetical protein